MKVLDKNQKNHRVLKDLISHLIPAIVAIFLFQILAIQIYFHNTISTSKANFFIWIISQAIGSFFLGYISDKFSRKKTFVFTQVFGVIALLIMFWIGYDNFFLILFLGLTFSPSSIVRAALIDNFPNESKVKVIGISFIAVFMPWCLFTKLVLIDAIVLISFVLAALIINLVITIFVFEDKRDLRNEISHKRFFIEGHRKKAIYTVVALLMGQIVFFLSDSHFEESSQNAPYYNALGVGVLLGAIISIFYRNIPHISLLTVCYGVGLILTFLSVIAIQFLNIPELSVSSQIMLYSVLGGFYLPFVFDIILTSVSSNYRGAVCGFLEVVISISSFIGLGIILVFNPKEISILMMMTILFLIATTLQKRSENL